MTYGRNGRERQKNGQFDARQARGMLSLLSDMADNISEFLWAALVTDETYPELADAFERMAGEEASRFRALGGVMLRCGIDPTVRSLLYRQGRGIRGLREDSDTAIESFLQDMSGRTEAMLEESLRLLTVPGIEGDDTTARILDGQEAQLRCLRQMLS